MFRQPASTFQSYRRQFPVVTGILAVQLFVFVVMTASGGTTNPEVLVRFGAKVNDLIDQGQWWRLVTPILIHIGLIHLLFNSFALYIFGPTAEWLFGRFRFFLFYVLAGFGGNVASYWFNPYSVSAGASGAIYGLFGMYVYLYWRAKRLVDPDVGKGILALVVINLLLSFSHGIDLAAHLGGLITGFILTPVFMSHARQRL